MLTVSDDDANLFATLRAGAVGYLVKDIDLRILPRALRDVAEGDAAIPRSLVARMVKQFHGTDPRFRTTAIGGDLGPRLTSRERDVLVGLADGLSTREIGRKVQLKRAASAPTSRRSCRSSGSQIATGRSPSSARPRRAERLPAAGSLDELNVNLRCASPNR
jgi:hypothetical protein